MCAHLMQRNKQRRLASTSCFDTSHNTHTLQSARSRRQEPTIVRERGLLGPPREWCGARRRLASQANVAGLWALNGTWSDTLGALASPVVSMSRRRQQTVTPCGSVAHSPILSSAQSAAVAAAADLSCEAGDEPACCVAGTGWAAAAGEGEAVCWAGAGLLGADDCLRGRRLRDEGTRR